jgi:hypothetical protein
MKRFWIVALLLPLLCGTGYAAPVMIQGVPDYLWHDGCAPTAAADILGYWGLISSPLPDIDALATLMGTSPSGWTWLSDVSPAIIAFAASRGSSVLSDFQSASWGLLTSEVDKDDPPMLLVDTNGDGVTDHFVPVIGYDPSDLMYGVYTTWTGNGAVTWEPFNMMAVGIGWGAAYLTTVDPVPIPSMMIPLLFALICLMRLHGQISKKNGHLP